MDLQNIITDVAAAKADFMGETLKFKYRPGLITTEAFSALEKMTDPAEMADFFYNLIVSWDLTKGGEPVPVTIDAFKKLPIQLLTAMTTAVMNDVPQSEAGKALHVG